MASEFSRVRRNFSRSAGSYDASASFQAFAAERLASLATEAFSNAKPPLSILELGAGTGLLTERLLDAFPTAKILASDLSAAMLETCERKLASAQLAGRLELRALDFNSPEALRFERRFDLVAASLALQWSDDFEEVLRKCLALLEEGGLLCFSIPLAGSLSALASRFESVGANFPGLPLLTQEQLASVFAKLGLQTAIHEERFSDGPFAFLDALRRLQALGTLNAEKPLSPSVLRKAMRSSSSPFSLNYFSAFCVCPKLKELDPAR